MVASLSSRENDGDGDGGAAANVFEQPVQTRNIFDNRNRVLPDQFNRRHFPDEQPINAVNRYLNEAVEQSEDEQSHKIARKNTGCLEDLVTDMHLPRREARLVGLNNEPIVHAMIEQRNDLQERRGGVQPMIQPQRAEPRVFVPRNPLNFETEQRAQMEKWSANFVASEEKQNSPQFNRKDSSPEYDRRQFGLKPESDDDDELVDRLCDSQDDMDSLVERNLVRQRVLQNEEAKEQRNRS